MVIVVGRLAVPQLVADLRRVSTVWMVYWVGCVGGGICCSSMVPCGLGLGVGSLSSRCGGVYTGLPAESELRLNDALSATGVEGKV